MSERLIMTIAAVVCAVAAPARGGDGALIADSVAEFSPAQGADGWSYGHYAAAPDPGSFEMLCCFDPAGDLGAWWELAPAQPPFNTIWGGGQHPDATPTVRRWTSEVTGLIRIDVTSGHWPGAAGAATVRLRHDGELLYERMLPAGAGETVTEPVLAVVTAGGSLDLVVAATGDPAGSATLLGAEVYRLAVFPPGVTAPAVLEVPADPGLCVSSIVPAEPAATPSCQGAAVVITGSRDDGLALDAPYPVGLTRIDWLVEEPGCPNDALLFEQWVLVRADGCPDCNGNGLPDECGVQNLTQGTSHLTIQGAIEAAADGDEIVAGPGTYDETIDVLGRAITLRSAAGRDETTIDLEGMPASAVTFAGGEGPETMLEGFTITGCTAPALSITGGSPTVTGCRIRDNEVAGDGAGVHSAGGGDPTITHCVFTGNAATGHGAGLYSDGSSMTVTHCTFAGNSALRGAGIYMQGGLEARVSNCVFSANDSAEGTGMWLGVFDEAGSIAVTSCTFSGNTGQLGSGIWMASTCGAEVHVTNCILWDQVVFEPCPEHCYEYNDGDLPCGAGNINADPLFADPDGPDGVAGTEDDDLRPAPGSPCIDAGTNDPPLAPDLACGGDLDGHERFADDAETPDTGAGVPPIIDMGAWEHASPPLPDCDGDHVADACAIAADPGLDADGTGVLDACEDRGDLDGDGVVGITDFLAVLSLWGPCPDPPAPCPADLDGDGTVGITDLLLLLMNWG